MTTILALDLGTATGWALRTADDRITSGTQSFKPGRFEGGGMRYLRFGRWLSETMAAADGIGTVYFEEVRRHAGVDAAHDHGGFLAALTAWWAHHSVPFSGVPVGVIKRQVTGKGNAGKAAGLPLSERSATTCTTTSNPTPWRCFAGATEQKLNLTQTQVRGQYEDHIG